MQQGTIQITADIKNSMKMHQLKIQMQEQFDSVSVSTLLCNSKIVLEITQGNINASQIFELLSKLNLDAEILTLSKR